MEKIGSNRKSYWENAEYTSQKTREGQTLTSVAEELSISLQLASKLRKAYELYVLEYGIDMKVLERVSIYDLHDAHGKALKLVKDKESAERLVNLLRNGKDFNEIRKEAKVAAKSRAEHVIEDVKRRLAILKVAKVKTPKRIEISHIVEKYHMSISQCRDNPVKAERLLVDCFVEIASTYIDS